VFDVGFSELVLLFIIGLLVLGPQRLPKVAAEIGKWVGRARRTATELRRQLEREIELNDLQPPPPGSPTDTQTPAPPPPTDTQNPFHYMPPETGAPPADPNAAPAEPHAAVPATTPSPPSAPAASGDGTAAASPAAEPSKPASEPTDRPPHS
jgi:sec-independent protein translocase protein TatB